MNFVLAYFDPSAGSLLLQALVGGFSGIVVVGRYLWMQFIAGTSNHALLTQGREMQLSASDRPR